jgi:hypothetical protein
VAVRQESDRWRHRQRCQADGRARSSGQRWGRLASWQDSRCTQSLMAGRGCGKRSAPSVPLAGQFAP